MKKIKFIMLIIFFLIICFYLIKNSMKTKEIELTDSQIGKLYKEYIITKTRDKVELIDYFKHRKIDLYTRKDKITKENLKNIDKNNDENIKKSLNKNKMKIKDKKAEIDKEKIIEIENDYELVQLNKVLYLKTKDEIKQIKAEITNKLKLKNDRRYIFRQNKKYGMFDKNLNILKKPIYDGIYGTDKSSLLLIEKDNKFGYMDKNGKQIIPFEYEIGTNEKNGLMIVKKGNMIGVIDKTNKEILNFKYKAIYYDKEDIFIVLKDKNYFLIDRYGVKNKMDVSWMGVQRGDRIFYEKNGLFGIYSFKNGYITKNIYKELSQNYTKLIIEMKNKKYGLINNFGKQIVEMKYDYILQIGNNYFKAGKDTTGYVCLINQNGKILTKEIYDNFIELNRGNIVAIKDNTSVLLNEKGKVLTKDKYDTFIKLNDKNIIGVKDNKLSLLNEKGKKIKEIEKIIKFNKYMLLYKENGKNILRKI